MNKTLKIMDSISIDLNNLLKDVILVILLVFFFFFTFAKKAVLENLSLINGFSSTCIVLFMLLSQVQLTLHLFY